MSEKRVPDLQLVCLFYNQQCGPRWDIRNEESGLVFKSEDSNLKLQQFTGRPGVRRCNFKTIFPLACWMQRGGFVNPGKIRVGVHGDDERCVEGRAQV